MEVSFHDKIASLRLGEGDTFHGEGILAVTKALLQSGVSYVGGYQGAPISHLLDVMVQARDYMQELGVHVEPCTSEASAAAMLGASIVYPVRGAVSWKSVVGTNVASDALSYLSTAGVMGGALVVVGEDYGEGASIALERTLAFALKSSIWMLDPRPNLTSITDMVEKGFELSEASNSPVMLALRIRACHVKGSFTTRANRAATLSSARPMDEPAAFLYERLSHPPETFRQEKLKAEVRLPAARRFIAEHRLNEVFEGSDQTLGIIVPGGLHNNLLRALELAGLADAFGNAKISVLALNVVYPLVPEEIAAFCASKKAVLVVEEGQPEFIEQDIAAQLRRAGIPTPLHGKDMLPLAGEYTTEVLLKGLSAFVGRHAPHLGTETPDSALSRITDIRERAAGALDALPPRPPGLCTGCPERPIFTAMKMTQAEIGKAHIAADIGCHAFATYAPFSQGNTILGYGMSLASAAGVGPMMNRRTLSIMGDGGFWHNGLLSGVSSSLLNKSDSVLVVIKNGYTSATGTQEIVSSPLDEARVVAGGASAAASDVTIENALRGVGVKWLRTVHTYRVPEMIRTLREAFTTPEPGLKVIVAEGECQLERQRRIRPVNAAALKRGERVVRTRFGVDEDTCNGDHACIRLSGCPSLTIRDSSDPLKLDPVAHVNNDCVGCGLCGEVAHAAVLCPSFFRAEIIQNPGPWDRFMHRLRTTVIGWLQPA